MGSTSQALLYGVNAMCVAFSGFLTGPLLKIFSMRQLAVLASTLFNVGAVGVVFAKSEALLFISQALFQSFGFGMLYNISCTILNDYFLSKRLLVVSFTQTFSAAFAMIAPIFVKWSLSEYGFRGTLILIAAVSLHSFIATAVMQPVAWHMKKVESTDDKEGETQLLLLEEKNEDDKAGIVPTIKLTDAESKKQLDANDITNQHDNPAKEKGNTGIKKMLKKVLDVSSLRPFLLSNASFGLALCVFCEFTYVLMLPLALESIKWDKDLIAWALSLFGLGDLVTRILFTLCNKWLMRLGSHEIYVIGLVVAVVTRLAILWSKNKIITLIFITIMGASRCTITVFPPLVVSDAIEPEQFSSAMGIFMMLFGTYSLTIGPAVGKIRDVTDSYATVYYILISCFASVAMFWCIELCYKKNKHKRKKRELEKSNKNKEK